MASGLISQILSFGMLLPLLGFAQTSSPKEKTIWDQVFSPAQVDRGATAYNANCRRCHGEELDRLGSVLIGGKFMDRWREDNLYNLYKSISDTMPPGPRGRMTESEYLDVVAYILGMNAFPAGKRDLEPTDLERILIVGKDGPRPVPDFALVTVAGCLTRDGAKGWMLTNASEPVRTHNPRESSAAEFAEAMARPGGSHTFHFLDTFEFTDEFKAGRWMEAKGFLIRSSAGERINPTWLKRLKDTCESRR